MLLTTEKITYLSTDGINTICGFAVYPENPKMIVQIAHGIAEHSARYLDFARALAERGIAVFAEDHLGHGETANAKEKLGWFAEKDGWQTVINDILTLKSIAKEKFPNIPFVLMGHSMGSFLARNIAILKSNEIDALVLSGTGNQAPPVIAVGKIAAKLEGWRLGSPNKGSQLINNLAFSAYNKKFAPNKTPYDWLSNDLAEIEKYVLDEKCGFLPTPSIFYDMLCGLSVIGKKSEVAKVRPDLPILLFSGDKDPVGAMGKGVNAVYNLYKKSGLQNVTLKLYKGGRHELLNDSYKDEVINDLCNWLDENVK